MARPPKVTDEQILDVACRCFLAGGPTIPTSAIADELGVSEAALFKRFGTKRELLLQACAPAADPPFLALTRDGPDPDQPIAPQMEALARAVIAFFREMMPRIAVLKAAGISPLELLDTFDVPPPVRGLIAIRGWLDAAVAQGQLSCDDTESLAFLFMGSLHGRTMLQAIAGRHFSEFDVDRYAATVVQTLMDGIGGEGA